MSVPESITLLELNNRITKVINFAPGVRDVWVTAETLDLRVAGQHCYLELIDKDPESGTVRARMRATIWGTTFNRLNMRFIQATGAPLASNLKIMVRLTVTHHPVYGLAANITDLNPEFTLGDLMKRRREMLERLEREGILNNNRQLKWPTVPWRIAIISAQGAAGYGDFINQLYTNNHKLRFRSRLFPAVMQGESTAASVIGALEQISNCGEEFDCVVIIRGGGSTGDLASFDNYELAANIAMYPLPVIVGIGHERDVTLLDYVANMRVKTPTAAAAWLISRGADAIEHLRKIASDILDAASQRINSAARKIELYAGQIPELGRNIINKNQLRIGKVMEDQLLHDISTQLTRRQGNLNAYEAIIEALSPEATLRRGFSITRVDGKAITSAEEVPHGSQVVTTLADGEITTIYN